MKMTLRMFLIVLLGFAAVGPMAFGQGAATLKDISFQKDGNQLIVTVAVAGAFSYESGLLTAPKRLVIDLSPVDVNEAAPSVAVGQAGVIGIRTGQFKPQTMRVVFDLGDSMPAYSVSAFEGGLRIVFTAETEEIQAPPEKEKEIIEKPRRETPRAAVKPAVEETSEETSDSGRTNFFLRLGTGYAFCFNPTFTLHNEFAFLGETATLDDTYKWKNGLVVQGEIGKYMRLAGLRLKAGIGGIYWKVPTSGTFLLRLPHPYTANTFAEVPFNSGTDLATSMLSVYTYGLFSFLDTGKLSVWFGPFAALAMGDLITLYDFDIDYKAPFTSSDITISNLTYTKEAISELAFGVDLNLQYELSSHLSFNLDAKVLYLNPKSANLGKRINWLQLQPGLSLQYNF